MYGGCNLLFTEKQQTSRIVIVDAMLEDFVMAMFTVLDVVISGLMIIPAHLKNFELLASQWDPEIWYNICEGFSHGSDEIATRNMA